MSEKYNSDLFAFLLIVIGIEIKNVSKFNSINYFETKVIKLCIKKLFFCFDKSISFISLKHIIFKKAIRQIGNEFINRDIDADDDTILILIFQERL